MQLLSPKAQVTREKILRTANDLFYLYGYNSTGLDRIVSAAGVTKGNFYYHFKSKEELAIAVLDWHRDRFLHELHLDQVTNSPPLEILVRVLEGISIHIINQGNGNVRGCFFGNFALEMSIGSEAVRGKVQEIFDNFRQFFRQLLEQAQARGELSTTLDATRVAGIILNLMEGAILLDKAAQQPHDIYNAIAFIKEYLNR
jgi:TetR/AcrR family transcriptional repressor of nem operon